MREYKIPEFPQVSTPLNMSDYQQIKQIADAKNVSMANVFREAIRFYVLDMAIVNSELIEST